MRADDDSLGRSVDEFFDRVDAGEHPDPFDFEGALGSSFADFMCAVEAKAAIQALVEPVPTFEPPETVGPYTLSRKLGRGGGGVVYEARDERSGKRVALKLIHDELTSEKAHVGRFRREGRLGARLDHAHLVKIHETGAIDDQLYCAMELVEGPTLKQRLQEGALPPTSETLEQFAGLADGLAVIHRAGIVHRDVKPANILITPGGRFLLGDFGLVRSTFESTITGTGEAVGTIGYMSPEQLRGDGEIDGRTDVYALGSTIYEAFTGRPAIDPGTIVSMVQAVRRPTPPDPRSVRPDLPDALAAVIMTAMERRPEDRYSTAEALRDDLRRLAGGGAVHGRPVGAALRWVRRRPGLVLVTTVLAIALAAFGVYFVARPGTLEIESHPSATVVVDGTVRGRTPLRLQLDPGKHEILLERERFAPKKFRLTLTRGSNPKRTQTLMPKDLEDREALRELAESLGYKLDRFESPTDRGAGSFPVGTALLPRGRCRKDDLVTLRFEASDDVPFPLPAKLVMRSGETTFFERRLTELDLVAEFPFPEAVRRRLRAGDTVEWGVVCDSGREFLAVIEVVEAGDSLRADLARLDRDLEQAPDSIRRFLRAHAFLAHDLPLAALREARDRNRLVRGPGQDDREQPRGYAPSRDAGVLSLGTSLRALRALGVADSRLGDQFRDVVGHLPAARLSEWFR